MCHDLRQATEDKQLAIAQADRTASRARLAERLIVGLSDENQRWTGMISEYKVAEGEQYPPQLVKAFSGKSSLKRLL